MKKSIIKRSIAAILVLALSFGMMTFLTGCDIEQSTDKKQTQRTNELMKEADNQIGIPNIKEFYEKKMAKKIFELRDNSQLITYAYFQTLEGRFVYLGQCVGFGLPYSTQFTNPEKTEWHGGSGGRVVLPQADPNGLFTPTGLSATWLMYINPETGEPEVIYTEPSIVVTQSKLPTRLVAKWSLVNGY